MRTLLVILCLACAATNVLLLADWASRGEALLATAAAGLAVGCGGVAVLVRRLRW
jgi:hypothetical protein